jgi:hypothetical protein
MAAGATYFVGKDLEMSNSGIDSLERVQPGASYLAGKESINGSENARSKVQKFNQNVSGNSCVERRKVQSKT